ncbi:23S rRNA pseudouridine(2604) synthase RluF [Thiomicrorhabdus sediminis]|uniref:Pseudouridine synthase n=1 Tax=Thiomicrorhabdus sediminis TaxID=2580412 RepID=A0A4P9K367_9GAMM|nr:23S rRNA pseudouridine(2604) synthase RluF [Thiomicrorhabdus sediminis]QCU89141.1 23S rRNA pseudouridine(2604) synthase RluF [Thiomicrorhabdus sediminis]
MTDSAGKRLNKYISDSGFCSRREADRLIEQNRVTLNGNKPDLGSQVFDKDEVRVDGKLVKAVAKDKTDRVYIAYNKPIGITCTTERKVKGNIVDAINFPQRIFPIGRLDKPSEGLIFLTSDGDIVNKILRAENAHDKEYVVTVDKPLNEDFAKKMAAGIPILGTVTKPCKVTLNSKFIFTIVLTQGLNRQIRRMCEYLGYEVMKLKRVRIMNVDLGRLKPGQWRHLNEQEMIELNQALAGSRKTSSHANAANPKKKTTPSNLNKTMRQPRTTNKTDQAEPKRQNRRKANHKAGANQNKPGANKSRAQNNRRLKQNGKSTNSSKRR